MKRFVYAVSIIAGIGIISFFLAKPLMVSLAKEKIQEVFPNAIVSIGKCSLAPFRFLAFSDLTIREKNSYDIKLKQLRIDYTLLELIRAHSLKVSFPLQLQSPHLSLEAGVSVVLDFSKQIIRHLELTLSHLDLDKIKIRDLALKAAQSPEQGYFSLRELRYDRIASWHITARPHLEGKILFLEALSAEVLGGQLKAELKLALDKTLAYTAGFKASNLDVGNLVNDLKLAEKFQMSGKSGASLSLEGQGFNMKILEGEFSVREPGGFLVIKDKKIIENIARSSGQSLEILVESLKNYHYNKGLGSISLKGNDVFFDVGLEGEAGKRSFTLVWHDFLKRKE